MSKRPQWECALTIAGSDSGGGAGIQADLKTFAALEVHGLSVITCVTAQNPKTVTGVQPISPSMVKLQMDAVLSAFPVRAVKLGMLFSRKIMKAVGVNLTKVKRQTRIIVDPVMVSTSGKMLLQPRALRELQNSIIPLADLVTPNVPECEALTELKIEEPEDLRQAARILHSKFGCAVLAKGGHLKSGKCAIDIYFDGKDELLMESPFVKGVSTHGTGCTLSAAICGYCAKGASLTAAVRLGKEFITNAIAGSVQVGRHDVLLAKG